MKHVRRWRWGLLFGLLAALFIGTAWAREETAHNEWVLASPRRQTEIQNVTTSFLTCRARMEWMYEDGDLTAYLLNEGADSQSLQFFVERTKLFSAFREENGIFRENFQVQYTFGKISYQPSDDTYYTDVTEEVTYRIIDGNDMDTYVATQFQVTLKETENGFKIMDVYDPEDWFTAEYEEEGFDYEVLLEDYTGEEPVAAEVISEPEETIEEAVQSTPLKSGLDSQVTASVDGPQKAAAQYRINTYRPYNAQNGSCYAYTYSANDGSKNTYYNDKFYYHYQTDCINFGSQCIWAGFGGSNDDASILNHNAPMDAGGTWQWYGRAADDSEVSYVTWRSNQYFNRYMTGMNHSGSGEAGVLSRIIELPAVSGSGNGVLEINPFDLLGAVLQVKGGSTDYAHAIFVVGINPTKGKFTRNNVYFCSHTNNRRNACLGDWFPNCKIRVFQPLLYRDVSYCTQKQHVYSKVEGGSDGTCNACGFVRLYLTPYMTKPVSVGTETTIGGTANLRCDEMRILVKAPGEETAAEVEAASDTRICRTSYSFDQAGLYEITVYGTDQDRDQCSDSVSRSVTYTVRVS